MLTALLSVALLQAPAAAQARPVAVVASRRVDISRELADDLARLVYDALERAGVGEVIAPADGQRRLLDLGVPDAASCQAKRPCVAALGTKLGAAVVIGIDIGAVQDDIAVSLEAIESGEARKLAQRSFLVARSGFPGLAGPEIEPFIAATREAMPRPLPADAPRSVEVRAAATPPVQAPSGVDAAAGRPPIGAYLTGGGAVVAAGAAAAFAALGLGQKSRLPGNAAAAAAVPRSQANAISGRANTDFTLALTSAVAAAALGSITWVLWPRDEAAK